MFKNEDRFPRKIKLLFKAAKEGNSNQICPSYIYHKNEINAKDSSGLTPLYYAITNYRINMVQWLMEHGADVNIRLGNSDTAVHEAFLTDNFIIIQLILKGNPPPNYLV